MKVKKMTKRICSMLLALVMVLTMVLVAPVTAEAATSGVDYRILHLDNGRKYFTVDWIKALITEMKAAGFTHLELAFGNDGLRFLLDDMSVGSYSDAEVTAAIQNGNKAYNNKKSYSTSVNELTQAEMDEIIAHAKATGIEIIPLLNNPGHMYTLITAMTNLGMSPSYNGSASTIDLQDSAAVSFMKSLLQKYVNYFAAKGCKVFNIGADEYANDKYSSGAMGFGHLMSSGKYQLFVDYVNELNTMIKAAGMKTMAFNDGIYFQGKTSYAFDTDIMISFWTSGWGNYYSLSAKNMAAKGHPMINTHGDYYYILGVNDTFTPGTTAYHADGYHTQAAGFTNTSFMSSTVSNPAGSMFCVWSDYPGAETETQVARYIRPILRVMGARMQNSSSYEIDSIVEGGFNADGTINVVEHVYEATTVAATCTSKGYTTYTCSKCGDSYKEEIPVLGHNYESVVTEPTCDKAGYTTYTCAGCGDSYAEEIPALGHDYKAVVTEPTCDKTGCTTYTCVNCGDSYVTDEVAALGHAYQTETVEATCVSDGGTVYTCTTCGHSYTVDKVAAFGHNYTTTTVDATCETAGSVTKTCATCGDSTVETIPALGHDYKTVTVDATCETAGSVTKTCAACGDSSVETIPALGHSYKTTTVEATCETAGSVTTACVNCGDKTVETIPALGHDYTSVTVDATCTADGYTYHTCATCGDSYTTNQTAALGHDYTPQQVGNDMVYTCTHCGHSYSESLAVNYTYDKVSAFTSGENYVITLYSGRKYYAVTHTNNTLSVKQVTVSGNKITSEITEDMLWSYNGGKLSYTNGNKTFYMYASTSYGGWFNWYGTTTLALSTTNSSTVTFSGNRLKVGSYYLRYSYGGVSLNRSATTSYLFKQNEE